jgi:hypothetical protein
VTHEPLYALARTRQDELRRLAGRRRRNPDAARTQGEPDRVLVVERVQQLGAIRLTEPYADGDLEALLEQLSGDEELRVRVELADAATANL